MKVKIGLITFHSSINYGAMLQAYAMQEYLLSCDYECVLIDYVTKPHELEYLPDGKSKIPRKNSIRYQRFMKFMKNCMILTENKYYTEKELSENFPQCDIYMTGSDQVWNFNFREAVTPVYFLNLQQFKNRIAYGPSMGRCNPKKIDSYKELLEKYEYIFPRENRTAQHLSNLLGKEFKPVVDPTLLLEREHWKKFVKPSKRRKPYLLYYIAENDEYSYEMAKKVAGALDGLEIIVLSYAKVYRGRNVYNCVNAGPIGFLNLVYNAEFVFTTSFHGTVFSIIYDVPFYTVLQHKDDSRIVNILKEFGLQSRMLKKEGTMSLSKKILLERPGIEDGKLNQLTEGSKEMLHKAIDAVLKK